MPPLTSMLSRAATGALVRGVPVARRWQQRLDNPEVRAGRHLVQRMRSGPLDVLYLGDSTSLFTAGYDTDQRTVQQMLADDLGAGISVHAIAGGGYGPPLHEAYARLLTADSLPPVIVLPLCVRVAFDAWARHPLYGYGAAVSALRRVDPTRSPHKVRAAIAPPRAQDMAAHDALAHPTRGGRATVGQHRTVLKDPLAHGLSAAEQESLLYAYHFGARVEDMSTLPGVTSLGRLLRDRGIPVVAYQTPMPVVRGAELHGAAFTELARDNLAGLDEAFRAGYGPVEVLQTGLAFDTPDFIDPADASEHLNQHGRLRLAHQVADAVRAQLSER